ncbi:MAG: GNAT family N-acetyltransferase [Gammaproteobacteria bacterium]|nr:GNAT family N-acetyltransferase [Gammaproteobacteria bacterium]
MKHKLQSERTILSPLVPGDVDLALEMFTDPEVVRYIDDGVMSENDIHEQMSSWIKRGSDGCIGVWCISDHKTGEKYGSCALLPMPIDEDDTNWDLVVPDMMPDADIEVGYFLKKSAWGKGLATEACSRLIRFAFEEASLTHVLATIDDDNHGSRNVLEKVGFVYQGRRRAYAEDSPIFQIDRDRWLEVKQKR